MKWLFFLVICLIVPAPGFSQKSIEALQGDHSLRERFLIMKSKSQSYGDFKVIKESVLDGVWKIQTDSMAARKELLRVANGNIKDLKVQLEQTNATLKQKEQSMTQVMHASTHITVLGIDILKGAFITIVGIILAALVALLVLIIGRMKLQSKSLSERNLAVSALTSEFEDYKHRAMDKQTKLSRELQDERNKLQAIIRNS